MITASIATLGPYMLLKKTLFNVCLSAPYLQVAPICKLTYFFFYTDIVLKCEKSNNFVLQMSLDNWI